MSENIIKVNRGDSCEIRVFISDKTDSTKKYLLAATDTIYFALLFPHQSLNNALFIKGYDYTDQVNNSNSIYHGSIKIELSSLETQNLDPGIYYYTVKLKCGGDPQVPFAQTSSEEMSTVVERTKFIVNE